MSEASNRFPNGLDEFVTRETARSEYLTSAFVDRQIMRLETHFASRRWRDAEWLDELCKMVVEFGEERTDLAITDCIRNGGLRDDGSRNRSFPPTIAELRACIPPPKPKWEHASPCRLCDDSSWVLADPTDHTKGVRRCPNYRRIGEA